MGNGTVQEPFVTANLEGASALASNADQRVLMVGQFLAAGTAISGNLLTQFPTDNSQDTLFGAQSARTVGVFGLFLIDINVEECLRTTVFRKSRSKRSNRPNKYCDCDALMV